MRSITLQTSDNQIVSGDVIGLVNFAASAESDGGAAILIAGSIYSQGEGSFQSSYNPASLVFATSANDSLAASGKIKINHDGNILPMQDGFYSLGDPNLNFKHLYVDGITVSGEYTLPTSDGSADQVIKTDGAGNLSFTTVSTGGLSNIVEDTTPQLGGTLDANGNSIDMGTNTITDTKVGQWDTAYGWGNHASAGYSTTDTTYTAGSGLTLVGTEFNTAGTGNFTQLTFDNEDVQIGTGSTDVAKTGIAIGYHAASGSDGGVRSIFIGYEAGRDSACEPNYNFGDNVSIGYRAGWQSYSLFGTFVGRNSYISGSGTNNASFGNGAGSSTKGNYNVAVGADAGNRYGSYNTCVGNNASLTHGDFNVKIGYGGGFNFGSESVAIGRNAGFAASGYNNIAIGRYSLYQATGNYNIEIIHTNTSPGPLKGYSNKINVAQTIIGDTSSKLLAIGDVSSANVTPDATLEILPAAATDTGLIVQGATSQSATLQEWQNSSETKLLAVGPDGGLEIPSNSPSTTTNKLYNDGSNLNFGTKVIIDSTNVNTGLQYQPLGGGLNVTGLTVSEFAAASIVTEAEGISSNDNDTTLPTSAAVKDYVDGQGYATLASPTFTGTPAAPTAAAGTNTTQVATTAYVTTAISNLVDGAPTALDTLNELAAALNDDASAATTLTNLINTTSGNLRADIDLKLENIVEDTTPQLGGTLDANGNTIDMGTYVITDAKVGQWDTAYGWGNHASAGYLTSVTFSDIAGAAVVTEAEGISSNDNDTTLPTSAAVKDYVDNNAGGGISNVVEDTTPQLGGNLDTNHKELSFPGNIVLDSTFVEGFVSASGSVHIGERAAINSATDMFSDVMIGKGAGANADRYEQTGFLTFNYSNNVYIGRHAGSGSQQGYAINIGDGAGVGTDMTATNVNGLVGNIAIGQNACRNENRIGSYYGGNVAIGTSAMDTVYNTESAVGIGYFALYDSKVCGYSVALGREALKEARSAGSVAIGRSTLLSTSGDYNTAIGYYAGYNLHGSNNIEIRAGSSQTTSILNGYDNKITIRGNSNSVLVGDLSSRLFAIGDVSVADITPDATLEVKPASATDTGLIVQAATSQSATLQEWQNSSETKLLAVGPDGGLEIPSNTPSSTTNKLYNDGSNLNFGTKVIIDSNNVNTGLEYQPIGGGLNVTGLTTTEFAAATLVTAAEGIGSNNNDTTIPTSAAVKAYADSVAVSPGGSDTQIQFNDGGSFGGDADLVWNKTTNALTITGSLNATTKSFLIDHPSKPGMKLQYASLEGPENGVYVRGTTDSGTITLPDYWRDLVHNSSITVTLTPVGQFQPLFVEQKSNREIRVGGVCGYYDYVVYGERKDVDKLEVEW